MSLMRRLAISTLMCQKDLTTDSSEVMNDREVEPSYTILEAKKLEPLISREKEAMAVCRFFSLERSQVSVRKKNLVGLPVFLLGISLENPESGLTVYRKELSPNGHKATLSSLSKNSTGENAPLGKRSRMGGALLFRISEIFQEENKGFL